MKKLEMNEEDFKKKVKNIESLGNQELNQLHEIKLVLWKRHKWGIAIKRIKE